MESGEGIGPSRDPKKSSSSSASYQSRNSEHTTETTPLLARNSEQQSEVEGLPNGRATSSTASSLLRSIPGHGSSKKRVLRRWPSILALSLLCIVIVVIMVGGFFAPEAVEEYSRQAMVFEPTSLSIDSFIDSGVRARVQGDFSMDASKVKKKAVRDWGRFGTWIAHYVESKETEVEVSLPEYGNVIIGTAVVPPIKVDIRNGHTTHLDFLADLEPGSKDGIRRIANDWVDGKLSRLRVQGDASISLKSGLFSLGSKALSHSLVFEGSDLPSVPDYDIKNLSFHEDHLPNGDKGIVAKVALILENGYPVDLQIPALGFQILVDGCSPKDDYIMLADAFTQGVHVKPKTDVGLNVTGLIRKLPDAFLATCPDSPDSPLDSLLGEYIHGQETTIYVRGSDSNSDDTPQWVTELIAGLTVPIPFLGHTFGHLIRNFSLTDIHFDLPDYFAEPDTPESQPRISAEIQALVAIPEEVSFPIRVRRVRSVADVFYRGEKLGNLDLHKWRNASSKAVNDTEEGHSYLQVEADVKKAPLNVTDQDLFGEVVGDLLSSDKPILLTIKANVDVDIETALGEFVVRRIPAKGVVPVKPISGRGPVSLKPKVGDLNIVDTDSESIFIGAKVNITNPTKYSAFVPYASINVLVNGTVLGHIKVENISVLPGQNFNIPFTMTWEPFPASGKKGVAVSSEFLSQFISSWNTTLTLKTHKGTIPGQPGLGKALEKFEIQIPTPKLHPPKDPDDGDGDDDDKKGSHFIQDATMHLISSTAIFSLLSPFKQTSIFLTHINATAYHDGNSAGKIMYELPIEIPPGLSQTPRLPVEWSLGDAGYDAIREALGGTLKLSTYAIIGVRLGKFEETLWFAGKGIGAKIRI